MLVANVCAAQFAIAKKQTTLFRVHGEPDADKAQRLKEHSGGVWHFLQLKGSENLAPVLAKLIEDTKDKPYLQTAILRTMLARVLSAGKYRAFWSSVSGLCALHVADPALPRFAFAPHDQGDSL